MQRTYCTALTGGDNSFFFLTASSSSPYSTPFLQTDGKDHKDVDLQRTNQNTHQNVHARLKCTGKARSTFRFERTSSALQLLHISQCALTSLTYAREILSTAVPHSVEKCAILNILHVFIPHCQKKTPRKTLVVSLSCSQISKSLPLIN